MRTIAAGSQQGAPLTRSALKVIPELVFRAGFMLPGEMFLPTFSKRVNEIVTAFNRGETYGEMAVQLRHSKLLREIFL